MSFIARWEPESGVGFPLASPGAQPHHWKSEWAMPAAEDHFDGGGPMRVECILLAGTLLVAACGGGGPPSEESPAVLQITIGGQGPAMAVLERQPAGVGYDAATNRLILYFQSNPAVTGTPNEVWVIAHANGLGGSPTWHKLTPAGTPPNELNVLGSTIYDSASNRLITYGGCNAHCSPAQSSVYVLTNANGLSGTPTWSRLAAAGGQATAQHSAVFDSGSGRMTVFAGHRAFFGTAQNDLRLLVDLNSSGTSPSWIEPAVLGSLPGARSGHSAVLDRINNKMIVSFGENPIRTCCPYDITNYGDVWVLTNPNGLSGAPQWQQLATSGAPHARALHAALYDRARNRLLVLGGQYFTNATQATTNLGDFWELSNANGLGGPAVWTELKTDGAFAAGLVNPVAALDEANDRVIVFGGTSGILWIVPSSPNRRKTT